MNRGWRGRAAAAVAIFAMALAVAAQAAAESMESLETPMVLHGVVTVTWHGDQARGCEAAGVCGLTGIATARLYFADTLSPDVQGGGIAMFGLDGPGNPGVVRTTWSHGIAGARTCVDQVDGFHRLTYEQGSGGFRLRVGGELSSGRCGGPTAAEVAKAIAFGPVGLKAVSRGRTSVDVSKRTTFGAGPFTGQVATAARVRLGRPRIERFELLGGDDGRGSGGARGPRMAETYVAYRLERLTGSFVSDFKAIPDPGCEVLGVCGGRGEITYRITGATGQLAVGGTRRVSARATRRGELRALRRGRYRLAGYGVFSGTARAGLSGRLVLPDGPTCTDSLQVRLPLLNLRVRRKEIAIGIAGGTDAISFDDDLAETNSIRTHCPGPTLQDALGDAPIARGAIPIRALGRGIPQLRLTRAGSFTAGGWTGATRADITARLRVVGRGVRFYKDSR